MFDFTVKGSGPIASKTRATRFFTTKRSVFGTNVGKISARVLD